ncbi:antitoxin [Campylobacter suis]|uniref:Antitoxin n=1 Tax=Campylobacter suis TaxID=2790657 RepID=A0ABN7K9C2_9BACT|nr:antitoxin [Campylobacter suis]CAD7289040.1 hypothetical protein LMG8286_01625 [Campylobacter suis]
MQEIKANLTASISELKKSPAQIISEAGNEVVAILNHNIVSSYLVPSGVFESMAKKVELYDALNVAKKTTHSFEM